MSRRDPGAPVPLPRVGHDTPAAVEQAAREFVRRKEQLDIFARDPNERWRVPADLRPGDHGTFAPHTFIAQVLPFAGHGFADESAGRPALVPTALTIGQSWKGRQANALTPVERESYRSHLTDPARADRDDHDAAHYTWFQPLGLVAAGEGQNRVAFLRDVGEAWIPAHVTCRGYPAPGRLRLFEVDVLGQRHIWATLDEQLVQAVPQYAIARELLAAYGVPAPVPWPTAWPDPTDVAIAHARQCHVPRFRGVDLSELQARTDRSYEETVLTIADITWLRLNPAPWSMVAAVGVVTAGLACFAPWWMVRVGALITVGGITIALGLLCLPLWRGRTVLARGGHADAAR